MRREIVTIQGLDDKVEFLYDSNTNIRIPKGFTSFCNEIIYEKELNLLKDFVSTSYEGSLENFYAETPQKESEVMRGFQIIDGFVVTLLCDSLDLKKIPEQVYGLENLCILSLSNNKLKELPSKISNLQNLETLYLDDCGLKYLPEEVGNLENLQYLDVANNKLKELPESILSLTELRYVNIKNNPELINSRVTEILKSKLVEFGY